jgi:hypothetical protein
MVGMNQKYNSLTVVNVKELIKVEFDHVYMMPQNRATFLIDRAVSPADPTGSLMRHNINPFFTFPRQ